MLEPNLKQLLNILRPDRHHRASTVADGGCFGDLEEDLHNNNHFYDAAGRSIRILELRVEQLSQFSSTSLKLHKKVKTKKIKSKPELNDSFSLE